jgi:Uma2 family endonuclease
MAALRTLLTVEEYCKLPDGDGCWHDLQFGEVVATPFPKSWQWILHHHLERVLGKKLAGFGEAGVQWPYRALAEFDLRAAEVAVVSHARFRALADAEFLRGAPELIVKVVAPSDTAEELRQTAALSLACGTIEYWFVERESVTVMRGDGSTSVYAPGSEIPLGAFGGDSLAVCDIFED